MNVENDRNWAGNYRYSASEFHAPENVEQIQEQVSRSNRIKVLGTRHSFNGIADSVGILLSLEKLNRVIALDRTHNKVTIEGGIHYGDLCHYLHHNGYALHNLASLPHISVAGACATASHGSGDRSGNLATAVHALEVVKGDGEVIQFSRDQQDGIFDGAVVGLGGLGVITSLTLDVIPDFQMAQYVYDSLPLALLKEHFNDIFSDSYSVSLFTDWKNAMFTQAWIKRIITDETSAEAEAEFFGAKPAAGHRHPVISHTSENCSEQMGIPGPWHERLPHFRMAFTPSSGDELQSEYYVPRQHAYEALCAIDQIREYIWPHLHVSEVRTIAQDNLWMSPCYKQDSAAFHFTWKADWEAVRKVLPILEEQLAPYEARPHWAKLFAMPPERLQSLYEKLPDFQQLLLRCDPEGKFRNEFLDTYIRKK
ncbi:FAD-binding protein [Paenibacillus nasutitermitis]|uniref:Xylitol oxidase n=1 Tax=Paenibacillus nasutitermitis TaxID=1652958 RepID=A0A916YST6_9BACL|nr:FAD-binding protein [Paenibacillus nasutitermitis]GGD58949.1 xylitol oxidase [Paenibacillus nasutitermitis]